ncbi:MAG TPA: methyltransferase domain-containing protein [Terracidiphilus sp.]|nr:methyltransferase domain-containing protein [Terracidiphilus sp.]
MENEPLSLLCDPDTRYSFELDGQTLRNTATGRVYPIRDGIPLFISSLSGATLRCQSRYDRLAPFYDLRERFQAFTGKVPGFRAELAAALAIPRGARVLEVAVGTGANIPHLPADIDFYGIDISWGMLRKCRKNLRKWSRQAHLFHGEAGRLPFCAAVFDCVFAANSIRTFAAPERAVREMLWVTRPGGRIVIVDEAAQAPAGAASPTGTPAHNPIDFVQEDMEDVRVQELAGGRLYCLSFRKPLN